VADRTFSALLPLLGRFNFHVLINGETIVAMASCLLALWMLYRRIGAIGGISKYLLVGVMATVRLVIGGGLSHFRGARVFKFSPDAFHLTTGFFLGMGSAMLVATYDYWGYYNVCFLGGEIRQPERNIPRAIVYSIAMIAVVYIVMNISILG